MKLKSIILGLLLLSNAVIVLAEDKGTDAITEITDTYQEVTTYTVKKGDTVYSIAAAHNTTTEEIYRLNPDARNGIKKGNKLKIAKFRNRTATGYSNHLIEAKETLFSVSRMYNITVNELRAANAGLDESNFQIGKTIRIPKFGGETKAPVSSTTPTYTAKSSTIEYKVQKGDTLYGISKKYNTTVEAILVDNPSVKEGLKEGMALKITGTANQSKEQSGISSRPITEMTPLQPSTEKQISKKEDNVIRVGVLLPFLDNKNQGQSEKMVEFYQGFLLGVKELKEKGYNSEVYAFDIGTENDTKKLESLLGTSEMNNLDFVVGGVSNQQIDIISRFSKKTGVRYIIPFGTKSNVVASNPYIFQATVAPTNLHGEVVAAFQKRFRDYNIICIGKRFG